MLGSLHSHQRSMRSHFIITSPSALKGKKYAWCFLIAMSATNQVVLRNFQHKLFVQYVYILGTFSWCIVAQSPQGISQPCMHHINNVIVTQFKFIIPKLSGASTEQLFNTTTNNEKNILSPYLYRLLIVSSNACIIVLSYFMSPKSWTHAGTFMYHLLGQQQVQLHVWLLCILSLYP